jgi:hypothetical protein
MITRPVVINNFIDPKDAEILLKEMHSPSERNPYPSYYKTRFGGTGYPYNNTVLEIQKKYSILSNKVHQDLNPEEAKEIKTFKAFGSTWRQGGHGAAHVDDQPPEEFIEYSTVIYLNDEFTGGDLYFPAMAYNYKPEKYAGVFFISDGDLWKHGISPVESGTRSTLLYMHTTQTEHPNGFVIIDPDLN